MLQLRSGLSAAGVLFLILFLALPMRFEVNDDYGAIMILSGADGFPGQPDVPFISRILNVVLFRLYDVLPEVPWFGVFVYLAAVLGGGLFLSLLFFERFEGLTRLLFAPAVVALVAHCFYSATFTSAALVLLLGTLAYTAAILRTDDEPRWWGVFGCLLMAYLWRWQLSLYFLVFAAPLALFIKPAEWRRLLPATLLMLVVIVSDRVLDYQYNRSEDQRAFVNFYQARSQFHDRPAGRLIDGNSEIPLQAAGWHVDDYGMFRQLWVLYDEQVFNTETISAFLDANRQQPSSFISRLYDGLRNAFAENKLYLALAFCCGLAMILVRGEQLRRLWSRPMWRDNLALLLVFTPAAFLAYFRFVPRLSVPLLLYLLSWLLLYRQAEGESCHWSERPAAMRWLIAGIGSLSVIVAAWLGVSEIRQLDASFAEKRMCQQCLQEMLRRSRPSPLLIRMQPGIGFRYDAAHPLKREPIWNVLRVLPAGWQTGSRRYRDIVKSLGAKGGRDLLTKAINHQHILFVQLTTTREQSEENLRLWKSYYDRRLVAAGQQVAFHALLRCKDRTGRILEVYRLKSSPSP